MTQSVVTSEDVNTGKEGATIGQLEEAGYTCYCSKCYKNYRQGTAESRCSKCGGKLADLHTGRFLGWEEGQLFRPRTRIIDEVR